MSKPTDPLDQPFDAEELGMLTRLAPQYVRTDETGRVIPLVTRREVVAMQRRYPSMDPTNAITPEKTGDVARDILASRYPTMFPRTP